MSAFQDKQQVGVPAHDERALLKRIASMVERIASILENGTVRSSGAVDAAALHAAPR